MRAMIMPGVKIGDGTIVVANSVVTKDVAPYSIVAGLVKYRFQANVINELLALKVYNWPEEKFAPLKPYLCVSNVAKLKQAVTRYEAG